MSIPPPSKDDIDYWAVFSGSQPTGPDELSSLNRLVYEARRARIYREALDRIATQPCGAGHADEARRILEESLK